MKKTIKYKRVNELITDYYKVGCFIELFTTSTIDDEKTSYDFQPKHNVMHRKVFAKIVAITNDYVIAEIELKNKEVLRISIRVL